MTYQELFKIEYNNKKFMIFLDENNRKTFLEIDKLGDYVYPILEDFIALHKIFNTKEPFICYAPRFKFTEKVRVLKGTVASLLTVVTMLNSIPTALAANTVNEPELSIVYTEKEEPKEIIINYEIPQEETIYISDVTGLERYLGELNVTKDMVLEAINKNVKLPVKYKNIAINLLNEITNKYSNFNLRIFYENIKDMEVVEYTIEEFKEAFPDAPGAGAQYNAQANRITTINEVQIEVLYHEMFHATHHFYRELDQATIVRTESNTAINESFTDLGSSLVVPNKEGYVFSGKIVNYLLSTIDYSLEEYNNKGILSFLEKLQNRYPSVDINYISETLSTVNEYLIYQGKQVQIDDCPHLINELFKICLANASLENGYKSFNEFAKIFYNAKNPELVFEYLEKYNIKLQQLGYKDIIPKNEAKGKFEIYKEATGIGYDTNETYPIIITEEKRERINEVGEKIIIDNHSYSNTFDFPSLISSTMFDDYDRFGTNEYWTNIALENGLINPHIIKEIPIYFKGKLLTTTYTNNLFLQVGLVNNELGFRLTNKEGEVIYSSSPDIKGLSNTVLFSYYISKYSNYIEKLNLEDVLNPDYLFLFQSKTSIFKNINIEGNILAIEPLYELNIIKENYVTTCYLNDCIIKVQYGLVKIDNTNIVFEAQYADQEIKLKDVFEHYNMLNVNTSSYNIAENELNNMIVNYLEELKKDKGR